MVTNSISKKGENEFRMGIDKENVQIRCHGVRRITEQDKPLGLTIDPHSILFGQLKKGLIAGALCLADKLLGHRIPSSEGALQLGKTCWPWTELSSSLYRVRDGKRDVQRPL
jgi:hypothetical protein